MTPPARRTLFCRSFHVSSREVKHIASVGTSALGAGDQGGAQMETDRELHRALMFCTTLLFKRARSARRSKAGRNTGIGVLVGNRSGVAGRMTLGGNHHCKGAFFIFSTGHKLEMLAQRRSLALGSRA
jgi:hypothetical protein